MDEKLLEFYIDQITDSRVKNAMRYSLMAGGKRIRPNMLYAVLKGYGIEEERGNPFAAALEMVHTYSLIHDDLPAMDDDDLRRGMPTCHKQFDEATAILAGDGLLTYAFEVLSSTNENPETVVQCVSILSRMAGPNGMVLGQDLDLQEEDGITSFEDVKKIEKYKTGCLLSAPLMMAAAIAKQSQTVIDQWQKVGEYIGLAFQVQDDILDVELTAEEFGKSNSDARNNKVTCVTIMGMEKATQVMNDLYSQGESCIRSFKGFDSKALLQLLKEVEERRK